MKEELLKPYDDALATEEATPVLSMHPKKFLMWLIIVSSVMVFAAFTSAYLVRRGEGNWLTFELPPIFWVSSIVIVISSVTMQLAYWLAKKDNIGGAKGMLVLTALTGAAFIYLQIQGWQQLVDIGVYFGGKDSNPAGSFVYVLTLVHIAHLLIALVLLGIVMFRAWTYRVHAKNLVAIEIGATFWHFLGVMWLYLFVFLLVNH
jgi:cytochrome c oxidase subunit 3